MPLSAATNTILICRYILYYEQGHAKWLTEAQQNDQILNADAISKINFCFFLFKDM